MYKLIQKARLPATRIILNHNIQNYSVSNLWKDRSMLLRTRHFASSSDWPQQSLAKIQQFLQQIEQHPLIVEQLAEYTELLISKGVDVSSDTPNAGQITKVLNDPEVKEKALQLNDSIYKAGIHFDIETLQELQADLNHIGEQHQEETIPQEEPQPEKERGRKRGVMNKPQGSSYKN